MIGQDVPKSPKKRNRIKKEKIIKPESDRVKSRRINLEYSNRMLELYINKKNKLEIFRKICDEGYCNRLNQFENYFKQLINNNNKQQNNETEGHKKARMNKEFSDRMYQLMKEKKSYSFIYSKIVEEGYENNYKTFYNFI